MPNGRTLANSGTGWGQLANCFVLPISDDTGRSQDAIFNTLRDAVLVYNRAVVWDFHLAAFDPKVTLLRRRKEKLPARFHFEGV